MRATDHEATILRQARLIIIDEITIITKYGLECVDKLLRELMNRPDIPFGNKVVVIGGDFRQTLPVVTFGGRAEIIQQAIKSSVLWPRFHQISLALNMRSQDQEEHNEWLLQIGDGDTPRIRGLPLDTVAIPDAMITDNDLVDVIFDNIENLNADQLAERAILAPKNCDCLDINNRIIARMPGNVIEYHSQDRILSEDANDFENYSIEFINEQTPSGFPPHTLKMKIGIVIMLLRNLDAKNGLCNGTRLKVVALDTHTIRAEILSETNKGEVVIIPKILHTSRAEETSLPFQLERKQFPVIPAYAMTINKSQGQSFHHVGILLNNPVFSHGQLYVALSRSRFAHNIKIKIAETPSQGKLHRRILRYLTDGRSTQNIVYREIYN